MRGTAVRMVARGLRSAPAKQIRQFTWLDLRNPNLILRRCMLRVELSAGLVRFERRADQPGAISFLESWAF